MEQELHGKKRKDTYMMGINRGEAYTVKRLHRMRITLKKKKRYI